MKIIEWVNEYDPKNSIDVENALREIMQEVALAGLERSGFFTKAAFYGGTALRIFHGLNRFSEDLDFSLLEPDPAFDIMSYLQPVITEFAAMGISVATMTYDSLDILKAAEEDYSVSFPMLRDEDVKHVSALGILNQQYQPGQRAYGIPAPGIFLVSADGIIRFKFAEQDYRMRPDFSLVLEAASAL